MLRISHLWRLKNLTRKCFNNGRFFEQGLKAQKVRNLIVIGEAHVKDLYPYKPICYNSK
jgi:hypothetical protein